MGPFGIDHSYDIVKGYAGALSGLKRVGETDLSAAKRLTAAGGGKKPQLATSEMRDNVASLGNQRKKALGRKY